jgi:hypothetical protein
MVIGSGLFDYVAGVRSHSFCTDKLSIIQIKELVLYTEKIITIK